MPTFPTLFVSHGSPMFAIEHGNTAAALTRWAASQPIPRAILIMSPHWMTDAVSLMASPKPRTEHDFGGFPEALYRLQYPAAGEPALALQIKQLLANNHIVATLDTERPFDHGAWVPLMHLYPQANIPVVQISLPIRATPQVLFAMGQALKSMRDEGVLMIASGSMTHNLSEFFSSKTLSTINVPAQPYVNAFARWFEQVLMIGTIEEAFNYRPHGYFSEI
jgi:4,5-DOPA dioxygenase extradiol